MVKYYKDDIVELITAKYKDNLSVPPEDIGYYENQGLPIPFVGQRFRVRDSSKNGQRVWGGNPNRSISILCQTCNVRLYKRPFRNWVKEVFTWIKS